MATRVFLSYMRRIEMEQELFEQRKKTMEALLKDPAYVLMKLK